MKKNADKFSTAWKVALALSFLLYFSGAVFLYEFFRKRVLRSFRRVILTYHRVHGGIEDPEMTVSIVNFKRHMACLARRFKVVSLDDLLRSKSADLSGDLVAITFDDGYVDNYLYAFPILKEHSFPATVFLIADLVNRSEDMLTLEQIRVMQQEGISFGSHTCTHPILADVTLEEAEQEIALSKTRLESMLHQKVELFAYPKGKCHHYDGVMKEYLINSGYRAAVTMENGAVTDAADLFELNRLGIRDVPAYAFETRVSGIFESFPFAVVRRILKAT